MTPGIDYIGVGCGALIINNKNETLLLKRGAKSRNQAGYWSKPGGTVEFGEKIGDAIKREIKEEFDVEIELVKFLGYTNHIIREEKQHWLSISYLAKIINGEPKNMEPNKHDEIGWFSFDNLPEKLTETTSELIDEYLKINKKKTLTYSVFL